MHPYSAARPIPGFEYQVTRSAEQLEAGLACWDALLKNNLAGGFFAIKYFQDIKDDGVRKKLTELYVTTLKKSGKKI